ncbi:MAG TPA: DUF3224 domain-containing protein [Brevundimonas sp.]|jgi:hypothetical protein|uniref:DUF3224 domain-containing protein n=1 Tax=Brevundimonas sp. TaxID=1871086 RepID=UPI002E0F12CA|nr:DUF3224 domain-containing protein [Brevundimonas sp.]
MRALTPRGRLAVLLLALALAVVVGWTLRAGPARAAQEETAMSHAIGVFRPQLTPRGEGQTASDLTLDRMGLTKTFTGDLEATGEGQMLTGAAPQTGMHVYVALERVEGVLHGRRGAFLLAHRGVMDPNGQNLSIEIVPGSGTGELAGIAGALGLRIVDGVHHYDLAYTLPGA